jgi:hypothetical protein
MIVFPRDREAIEHYFGRTVRDVVTVAVGQEQ